MSYLFPSNSMFLTLSSLLLCMYAFPSFLVGLTCKFLMLLYIALSLAGWFFSPEAPSWGSFLRSKHKSAVFTPHSLYTSYAVVTGASTGIGREMAKFLARDGFNLFLVTEPSEEDIQQLNALKSELQQRHERLRVLTEFVDLSSESGPAELLIKLEHHGIHERVDIWVNNAGRTSKSYFTETSMQEYETMMNLNVKAYTKFSHYALTAFLERGRGRLLNIGSISGLIPAPRAAVYSATKAYINALTSCLQYECEKAMYQKRKMNPDAPCDVSITLATFGAIPDTKLGARGHASDIIQFKSPINTISARRAAFEAINGLLLNQPIVMPGLANRFMASVFQILPDHVRNLVNDYLWGNEEDVKQFINDSLARLQPFIRTSKSLANKIHQSPYTQRMLQSEKLTSMRSSYNESINNFNTKLRTIPNAVPEKLKAVPQRFREMNLRMRGKIRENPLYTKFFTHREDYESEEEIEDMPSPVRDSMEEAAIKEKIKGTSTGHASHVSQRPIIEKETDLTAYMKPQFVETEISGTSLPTVTSAERGFVVEDDTTKGRLHETDDLDKTAGTFRFHEGSAAAPASVYDAAKYNQLNVSSEVVSEIAQDYVAQPAKAMDIRPSGGLVQQTDANLAK